MVTPIAGPFSRTVNLKGPPTMWGWAPDWTRKTSYWFRQKKPYDQPLTHWMVLKTVLQCSDNWSNARDYSQAPSYVNSSYLRAYNSAYSKLIGELGDYSMWAVNLLEAGQSLGMIVKRLTQLRKFTKSLNRFDFPQAFHDLNIPSDRKILREVRKHPKDLANNWLEYHFGWEPLVKDIGAGLHSLMNPFKPKAIKGRGKDLFHEKFVNNAGTSTNYDEYEYSTKVRIGVKVTVDNPNLLLLSQLGFVNPASVAWEKVPFSFVVDWFTNVGQVLGSYTDFVGLNLVDPYVSTIQVAKRKEYYVSNTPPTAGQETFRATYNSVYFSRDLGLNGGPTLQIRPFKGFSVVRGATAVSLLLQQMNGRSYRTSHWS